MMADPAAAGGLFAALNERDSHAADPLEGWLSSRTTDIHARLAHFDTHYGTQAYPPPPPSSSQYQLSVRSRSSMAQAYIHQPSNASTHPPSLYNYSDATPTETSVSTGLASFFPGVPLLEENNGVLERPRNQYRTPVHECAFWFLSCSYISSDREEWLTHCLSHFRGEEPPREIQCPLCDFTYKGTNGWTSWSVRMEHVACHHAMLGESLRTSRPDFQLFHHLWQKRLIDDQDLKELKGGNHNLTRPPTNYTVTNGRRGDRDGRRQRHQHVGRARQMGGAGM